MANFVLAYRGGSVPETEADQQAVMEAWMGWFGSLGDAVVDGGAPFGPSMTRSGSTITVNGRGKMTFSLKPNSSINPSIELSD